jgi:hypothetical protein
MVINFRIHEINQSRRKLAQIPTLKKIYIKYIIHVHVSFQHVYWGHKLMNTIEKYRLIMWLIELFSQLTETLPSNLILMSVKIIFLDLYQLTHVIRTR